MLIYVNWKIIKNNQIKKSYCLIKINVNLYHHTPLRHLKSPRIAFTPFIKPLLGTTKNCENKDLHQLSLAVWDRDRKF